LLAHSALELYLRITGQEFGAIESAHKARQSERLIADIFETHDRDGKLFDFLIAHLDNKDLRRDLTKCRDKTCCNVGIISKAIRHIFVHGHLTANPNRMKPERVHRICQKVSTFLVEFMDDEFHGRMLELARGRKNTASSQ
jgi:hypothetical protein